jgi:peptidoglycan/xylan/chitin deacetylase (PgdA/CDA1 family)
MFRHTIPHLIRWIYPNLLWSVQNAGQKVFLTFDDGPHPEITLQVLALLNAYRAKATFFCVGENVHKYPFVINDIKKNGHALGNHSYHHLNGWKADDTNYINDVAKCAEVIPSNLFRPPYGRIRFSQIRKLKSHFRIVMWSILARDYDKTLDIEKATEICCKEMKPGSIIVLHDSEKSVAQMIPILTALLEQGTSKGYVFATLNEA